MPSLRKTLTLLSLFFTLALAAPSPRPPMPEGNFIVPGQPTGTCDFEYGWITDSYVLRGRNWNTTESELKHAVKDDTRAMTAWKFEEEYQGGVQIIRASFNLAKHQAHEITRAAKEVVKPWKMRIKCG